MLNKAKTLIRCDAARLPPTDAHPTALVVSLQGGVSVPIAGCCLVHVLRPVSHVPRSPCLSSPWKAASPGSAAEVAGGCSLSAACPDAAVA
ncbi:hypothetical protein GN956_G1706 [Arapaima gigas]